MSAKNRSRFGKSRHLAVGLTAGVALIMAVVEAASDPPAASSRLQELTWLEGHWHSGDAENYMEEIWSAPAADSIMGVFRWVRNGKTWMNELLTITEEPGGELVFRLRHFTAPGMQPWEMEKDGPSTYRLHSMTANEVVFEDPDREHPRHFVFRQPEPARLVIQLKGTKNGKPAVDEFSYRRMKGR